jgi:hypothetical protein
VLDDAARRREFDLLALEAELNRRAAQLDRREEELLVLADELHEKQHEGDGAHRVTHRAFPLLQHHETDASDDAWWSKVLGRRRPAD